MSLVSEALRKARQEAAEKGAKPRGMVFRTTVVLGSREGRVWAGWIVGGVVAASALAGAGVAWWLLAGRAGTPAPSAPSARAPAAASLAAPVPTSAAPGAPTPMLQVEPTPSAAPTREVDRAMAAVVAGERTGAGGEGRQPTLAATPESRQTGAATPTAPPAGSPASPRPEGDVKRAPRPVAETAGGRERTFVVDADLGKVKLHLDYIVYRPKDPFAGINGQEVMIGSLIEGFTVEEISLDTVRLHDGRTVVVLRTH